MIPFGDRLAAAMDERGPLCVGIDPHPKLLQAWGLEDSAESLRTFTTAVYEGCAPYAAALKPQVALFERHGSAGLAVLEELFARAAEDRVLIVADAKRGDIGSTMKAYADAWLGTCSPLGTDSVTLSPYLGFESLRPALDAAAANQRGTFVLALTSNPEGKSVQHVGKTEDTGAVAKQIIAAATAENTAQTWERMGSCGLVVGATVGEALHDLAIDLSAFNFSKVMVTGEISTVHSSRFFVFSSIFSNLIILLLSFDTAVLKASRAIPNCILIHQYILFSKSV